MQSEKSQVKFQLINKISQGQGKNLQKNQLVLITIQQKNKSYGIPHQIVIGRNQIASSLQQILYQMKVGGQCEVNQIGSNLDKSSEQNIIIVKVIKIIKTLDAEIPHHQQAELKKQQGNTFVKNKDYLNALKIYQVAYKLIQYDCSPSCQQLKLSLVSNLALTTLNLNKFEQTITWCNKHLSQSQQPNKKIIYRKVLGYKGVKKWTQAKKQSEKALRRWTDVDTQNDFKKIYETIIKEQKEQILKQKAVYGKMFS